MTGICCTNHRAYTCFSFFRSATMPPTPFLMPFKAVRLLVFALFSLFLLTSGPVWAGQSIIQPKQVKLLAQLAQHPVWLKLLHFNAGQSEVLSNDFFLSPEGRHNPEAELRATIDAYSKPWPADNGDAHARCRFPARYLWLSSQIPLPDYTPQPSQCINLSKWSLPEQVKSISVFLVSGYLGNPASVFGHSLLKFNTDSRDDQGGLFDLTVNYGALVPKDESALRYIVNGIAGGYQAGFSDRYFYTQDLVYSRKEFRDIWDYELHLSDEQKKFLILHLWEILGKKFIYYFFDENCSFRLAELLELILEEPLLENSRFWYAPVETFHRLEEIDRFRKASGKSGLIQSVRFIPSAQRILYHRFGLLEAEEKKAVQDVIQEGTGGTNSLEESLMQVNEKRQPEVLDTLLAYANYRLVAEAPALDQEIRQDKKRLLLARLRLPPRTDPLDAVPERKSPAKGNPPLLTGLGIGYTPARNTYLRLHWSPFTQESVGRNSLGGDELTVLDTIVGIGEDEFFVDRFDLIRIRKLKTDHLFTDGKNAWSWQLRTGMESVEEGTASKQDFFFSFGAGQARKIGDSITAYALLDASAHTHQSHLRLYPHIGILTEFGQTRSRIYAGGSLDYEGDLEAVYGVELQHSLSAHSALSVDATNEEKISVELKWYW